MDLSPRPHLLRLEGVTLRSPLPDSRTNAFGSSCMAMSSPILCLLGGINRARETSIHESLNRAARSSVCLTLEPHRLKASS